MRRSSCNVTATMALARHAGLASGATNVVGCLAARHKGDSAAPSLGAKVRKVPTTTPQTAVREVERNFLGEEPTWEPQANSPQSQQQGSGAVVAPVDVDSIPLGIKIPWGDVQRQLQIFISNSHTDPKAINKGRTFLRDFDVLSNVTTIDEGLELLYYMDRLNYPANSRLELNLLSWLADNVGCIYVGHVLDVCRYALEQSSVAFWKRTLLCTEWFIPRLVFLLQGSPDADKFALLKKAPRNGKKSAVSHDEDVEQTTGSDASRGEFALEDLVLIARVLSSTGAFGDDTTNVTGDKSTSNNSSVRSGKESSVVGGAAAAARASGSVSLSVPITLDHDVAAVQRRLRPATESLTESAVRLISSEIRRIVEHHNKLDESTTKKAAKKKPGVGEEDEISGEEVSALNDFFHKEREGGIPAADASAATPKFMLNPLLLSNVVTFIVPLEGGEETKTLKKMLYAIFEDASAIDCMVYLSALAQGGVVDSELVTVLTKRIETLSQHQLSKWTEEANGTPSAHPSDNVVDEKALKKRNGIKKGALTRTPLGTSMNILKFSPPNTLFKLQRQDATVDSVYISKAIMLVMRLSSVSSRFGAASEPSDDTVNASSSKYLMMDDDAAESVVGSIISNEFGVSSSGKDSNKNAKELISIKSFLNDADSPPMILLRQLECHLINREAFFERVKRERQDAPASSAHAREVATAAGTVDADLILSHLDKMIDAVDAIELCGRYCSIAEAASASDVELTVASIDKAHSGISSPASTPQKGSNPGGVLSRNQKKKNSKKDAEPEAAPAASTISSVATQLSPLADILLRLENLVEGFVTKHGLGCQHASVLGHCLRIGSKLANGASTSSGKGTMLVDQLVQRCEELSTSIASSPVMQQAGFHNGNAAGSPTVTTPAIPAVAVIEREFKLTFETTLRIVEGLAAIGTFPPALVECCLAALVDKRSQLLPSDVATMVYVAGKASKTARIEAELINQLCHRLLTFSKFSRRGGESSPVAAAASASFNQYQVSAAPVSWESTTHESTTANTQRQRTLQRGAASGILSPNEVAMLLYGLAAANIAPDAKLQAYLGDLAVGSMDTFTGSECCALLLVIHQLKLQHSALGRAVGQEVASAVPRLVPEDLIRVAQVMGELGLRDVRLMTSIVNRLRQCKSLVQPIHLVSIAIALRETGFAPLFSRCGLEDVLRDIDFLQPNQATYLLAFVSPASQEFLLKKFVRTEADLRKLTVDSLLTVYSAETEAVAPIRTHVLSLLEGKVAPPTFPPEVASVALSKAVALSNDSQQAFHNLTHLIEFIGPLASRFQHTHTIALMETVRRCIAESIHEQDDSSGVEAVDTDDVVSKTDRVATLDGATFKVHSAVYRFLGRRLVAIVDSMSAEQCITGLEIYCHGKIRDDRVVKALFKRLSKFAKSIASSPRLTRSCVKLCEFYGAGWTSGLYAALNLSVSHATSSNKIIQYKGIR